MSGDSRHHSLQTHTHLPSKPSTCSNSLSALSSHIPSSNMSCPSTARRLALVGLFCAALPLCSAMSTPPPPSADCSSNRYNVDGVLSLSSASSLACIQSLSSLSSASTLFLAHQLVLIVLWSLLLLSAVLLSWRLYVTRADLFTLSRSSYYMPILLVLLLLTPASNVLYNAIAPLSSSSLLSSAWSTCWLFLSDLFLVSCFIFLYPYTRDLLLLSPVISDAQYNSFVASRVPRIVALVVLFAVLGLLIAAAVSADAVVLLVYVCVVPVYVGVFGACWLGQLYGLAARDVKAVRRISVATLPAKPADSPVQVARNSWAATTEGNSAASTRVAHAPSISVASTGPHSSLSSNSTSPLAAAERPHTANRPSESPKSVSTSNSLAPPPHPVPAPIPTLHAAPSSHSISISPFPAPSVSVSGPVTGRRVSMVVAVEAGRKPVKTFAAERVNVRRLMLLHTTMAVAFVAIYVAHVALLASSATQPAATVIALHLARGLVACLWCLLFVWTLWPSKRQLQKARDKQGRRNSIRRNSMLPVGATDAAAADGNGLVQAGKAQSPMLSSKGKAEERAADALTLAIGEQTNDALADDDDDLETSRERALILMSAAAQYMQQQPLGSRGGSPALDSSASPTASPFAHSAFATNYPPMPPLALSSNDPTSLLEPAALPAGLPGPAASSAASFAISASSARVRHSLPAIHVEPLLLRSLMQALTEPTTPQSINAPAGVLSPPGMLRDLPPPIVINRRSSEGSLPASSPPFTTNVGASSRAVGAARPTSASRTSARSQSSLFGTNAAVDRGHQRERSRAESIRKADVISPRTTSSRGSRQRIFTPTSANHTNAVDG